MKHRVGGRFAGRSDAHRGLGRPALVRHMTEPRIGSKPVQRAACYEVSERFMHFGPFPMADSGSAVDSRRTAQTMPSHHEDGRREQLPRLKGKVQLALRVSWRVPDVVEYFVSIHPRLRAFRHRLLRGGRKPMRAEKMELRCLFEKLLSDKRAHLTETVVSVLRPVCLDIKKEQPQSRREVMNLTCLVTARVRTGFERRAVEAARLLDDACSLRFSGLLPPLSFLKRLRPPRGRSQSRTPRP